MTTISVVIATYGDRRWHELAMSRAYPSVAFQGGVHEVHVEHFDDLEIGPARNAAAASTSGVWLLFLDADDELDPEFVPTMIRAADLFGCPHPGCEIPGPVLLTPSVQYVRSGRAAPARVNKRKDLRDDNWLIVGTLIPRWLFDQVGGFSDYPHGFEDWSLWAKAVKFGATIEEVPRAIYIAHVNPKSKHRVAWRNRREQVATHERIRRELFPELYA